MIVEPNLAVDLARDRAVVSQPVPVMVHRQARTAGCHQAPVVVCHQEQEEDSAVARAVACRQTQAGG